MDIMVEVMLENTNEKLWYSNNNLCINNRHSCTDSCFWIIMGVLKMKKILPIIGLCLGVSTTAFAQETIIRDHYKEIYHQRPYHIQVCKDVHMNGDRSGDMLRGAIIGGIIGNNFSNVENGGALGAVLGGVIGHSNSNAQSGMKKVCNTEVRYDNERQTVYSHSTIKFLSQGKWYTLDFKRK